MALDLKDEADIKNHLIPTALEDALSGRNYRAQSALINLIEREMRNNPRIVREILPDIREQIQSDIKDGAIAIPSDKDSSAIKGLKDVAGVIDRLSKSVGDSANLIASLEDLSRAQQSRIDDLERQLKMVKSRQEGLVSEGAFS